MSVAVGRFRLVKLVLLGQLDAANTLAKELFEAGQLEAGEIKEWPVLRTLREYDGFEMPTRE